MISNYNEQGVLAIINYMKSKGLNDNGIAGLLGNLYSESKIYPNNLQNSSNTKLGMTDDEYTCAVDNGKYTQFCNDRGGYGLAQWTSVGRKTGLYNYVKSKKVSIGDLNAQIEYLYTELCTNYKKVLFELTSSTNTIRSCAEIVVCKFEIPASVLKDEATKQATIDKRTEFSEEFYNKYLAKSEPSSFSIPQILLTNNDCYKDGWMMTPVGIVVHSTGVNNPNIKRYVAPDDGVIGVNTGNNDWNRPGIEKCVHAFVGYDKNKNVTGRQTLPWNMCCWGCGRGKIGSYNYPATKSKPNDKPYIQFEICEDDLTNFEYFSKAFDYSAELCAYLCKKYNISVENIVSHNEAAKKGMASNHADCDHWLSKFNKDMNWFRNLVRSKMNSTTEKVSSVIASNQNSNSIDTPVITSVSTTKVDAAKSVDKSKAGKYYTTCALNVRTGASVIKSKILCLPEGHLVNFYGYYTKTLGVDWYLVKFDYNGTSYTGYVHSGYLR